MSGLDDRVMDERVTDDRVKEDRVIDDQFDDPFDEPPIQLTGLRHPIAPSKSFGQGFISDGKV